MRPSRELAAANEHDTSETAPRAPKRDEMINGMSEKLSQLDAAVPPSREWQVSARL